MSAPKRCKFCGREGSRMTPIHNQWFVNRVDGYRCAHAIACIRRQDQLGQWHGKRVLYRQDVNGTRWTIRRAKCSSDYTLTCEYREHRVTSQHPSIEAAKAHCDDVESSWVSRSLHAYQEAH